MIIRNFLTEKAFQIGIAATSKEDIIKEIAAFFAKQYDLDEKSIFTALWEREKKGSTGLGKGLAVPHARISSITEMKLAVFYSQEGRDFDAYDSLPSHLFFVAIMEDKAHPQDQLNMLRLIVETAEKTDLMKTLSRVQSTKDLQDLVIRRITEAEAQQ